MRGHTLTFVLLLACASAPKGRSGADAEMVRIPAGSFVMGTSEASRDSMLRLCAEKGWSCPPDAFTREMPQRTVEVPAFELDRLEVTNEAYEHCVGRRACASRDLASCRMGRRDPALPPPEILQPARPAVCVTWAQADQYCKAHGKRLPTEAEWEKAARGTDAREFPWGNAWEPDRANWGDEGLSDKQVFTAPPGSFPSGASPYGALDMAGNVWEWVDAVYPDGQRVIRGGGYAAHPLAMRAAKRAPQPADGVVSNVGFRCAR